MDMSSRPGFYEIFRGKDSGKKVTGMNGYVVEMNNIRKSFGSVQAVKDGQFNLKKGEIHSGTLLGRKQVYATTPNADLKGSLHRRQYPDYR